MAAVDFISALGRVLHDGAQRDAFVANPGAFVEQIGLAERDRPAFLQLVPADLEFQARVLLRKRFVLVRDVLPGSCARLGQQAWPEFETYARATVPTGGEPVAADAFGFARHLGRVNPAALCPVELNRCRFAFQQLRFAVHVTTLGRQWRLPGVQILFRPVPNWWREWQFYFAG